MMAHINIDLKSSEQSLMLKLGLDLEKLTAYINMWRELRTKFIEHRSRSFHRFLHLISFNSDVVNFTL